MLNDMAYRGHEIIEERIKKYNIDCDLKYGYIDVAFKHRQLRELKNSFEERASGGFAEKYRMVEGEEINDVMGTEAYVGGLINNRNGHLHPLNLCLGEAKAAAEIGVSIFENSAVTSIEHGEKPRVKTQTGQVVADFVILAGNAYNELEKKKFNKLLFPATTFIIATEPLSEDEANRINPLDLAVCDMNEILDYYRLSADKRMLFGGRCNYTGREPLSIKATLLPRMLKLYPQLAGKCIEYEWGGKVGIVVNRVPLIGRASKNVFYSVGYCGHGVNVTHMASEIMAEAVAGTFERMDLFERVKHVRMPLGNKLGNYLVALGMMYYRLLDLR
jgi:glycine/D-amino acid oxidase-like deaminating enzyme